MARRETRPNNGSGDKAGVKADDRAERDERLQAALRANLRRRKDQSRARTADPGAQQDGEKPE